MIWLWLACASPPVDDPVFVRGGVIGREGDGPALADGRRVVAVDWTAGAPTPAAGGAVAPTRAECVPLYSVGLGDTARLAAAGGEAPDTSMAFSPDGRWLAIGSWRGEVVVVDGWTGAVRARRQLAETMVKQVAWSPDSATVYAGEASPDAYVHALDPATLTSRWTVRMADHVGTSAPPAGEDVYGVYTLPAVFGLGVLPDGDLIVVASHAWRPDGAQVNATRVLRLGPDGAPKAAWPADGPLDATVLHLRLDGPGGRAAFVVSRSASGLPPAGVTVDGVYVLDTASLAVVSVHTTPPLAPHFQRALVWDALDVSVAKDALLMGFYDGRVRVVGLDDRPRVDIDPGAPVMAGDVPIGASVGWAALVGDGFAYTTSGTMIPFGVATPSLRPPMAHPRENGLWVAGLDGAARWSWTGEAHVEGLTVAPDGRTLVVGGGARQSDDRRDLFGAYVFDAGGAPRSGAERLIAVCPTAAPVFFRHAVAPDGRIALAEHPFRAADGSVAGVYQVTVVR